MDGKTYAERVYDAVFENPGCSSLELITQPALSDIGSSSIQAALCGLARCGYLRREKHRTELLGNYFKARAVWHYTAVRGKEPAILVPKKLPTRKKNQAPAPVVTAAPAPVPVPTPKLKFNVDDMTVREIRAAVQQMQNVLASVDAL